MRKQILLVVGLPGSGKTTLLSSLKESGWSVFDDFKAGAFRGSPMFRNAAKYNELLSGLRNGLKCVVSDIDFCNNERRVEAQSVLLEEIPDLEVSWLFFANDPPKCLANIQMRNRASIENDIRALDRYSMCYRVPPGSDVIQVKNHGDD